MAKLTVRMTALREGGPGQPNSAPGTVLMPAEAGQARTTGRSLTGDAGAGRRNGSEQQLDATDATQLAVDPNRRLLGGRYQIGDVLGSGGMAEVFRGRDTRLTRDVAVKVLRADLARDPSFQMRFRREAQAAASLNHPAIVAVYDTGEEPSGGATIPYIVMEYVEGHTLRDVLNGEGKFSVERALGSTADVCAALEFSHRAGIIHRDIKPGNVMVTREGVVKVMDFGIARAITGSSVTMTQTAAVIGTASYLSPEQARGEHVDARSDVYSTGVLLYELLTGLPPFRGDSPVSVAYQHVKEAAPPPSSLAPGLPPAVDAIVMKALAKNVNNRYQSAAEFRDDLRRASAGQPVLATPLLPAEAATTVAAAPTVVGAGAAATVAGPAGPTSMHPDERTAQGMVYPVSPPLAPTGTGPTGTGPTGTRRRGHRNLIWVLVLAVLALGLGGAFAATQLTASPTQVKIPSDIVGQNVSSVTAQLQTLGLKVAFLQINTGGLPGAVTASSPVPGTSVDKGSTVTLTFVGTLAGVPDVVGQPFNVAATELRDKGFEVNTHFGPPSTTNGGTVTSQNPAGGLQAPVGSTVTIVVARIVAPTTPTVAPPAPTQTFVAPTPTPTPTPTFAQPTPTPTPTPTFVPPTPTVAPPTTTAPTLTPTTTATTATTATTLPATSAPAVTPTP